MARREAARETTTVSGSSGALLDQRGVQRQPGLGVEDDPARLAVDVLDPGGELRVVGQRGADPARRRRRTPRASGARRGASRSPEIHFESPVRVATLPSSVIADLNSTHGRPVRACLRKRLVEQPGAGGELALGDHDLHALVAQDPQPAAGGLLGRVVGGDHHAGDARPRGSRPCTAGSCPWWQHGSSETYIVAPRGVGVAAGGAAPRARRAARRSAAWKPSPSTSPSRTTTAPTIGFGDVRPRPPSASSIGAREVDVVGLQELGHGADRRIGATQHSPPESW